ncbi:MAG TPA: AAA family ATPase [Gemmataceae bacterium]|nr:AAA family ATPase [Gemmataceae bacterium]
MPVHHFSVLVVRDAAGFYTALPVEGNEGAAGFAATPALALRQLRDYLEWLYRRDSDSPGPSLRDPALSVLPVEVRPEYHVGERIYACDRTLMLRVHCVAGRLTSGLLVAALPLLGVRFYYHEESALPALARRYAELALKGLTPRELARHLPPPSVWLEEILVRIRPRARAAASEAGLSALIQVAEPLGDRAMRRQLSAAWEREALVAEAVRKLHQEKTSLLLVGEPGVGKTTILVEAARTAERLNAAAARRKDADLSPGRLFWMTSAGRLIAGMKYLGQWEERCEQVIDELARLPGVLCVESLLDLVRIGGTGPGDSLAAFLLPYLQRGELRLASECTPSELDACRRLLPGFADLLPILHVPPFDRTAALAVLERTAARHAQNLRLEVAPDFSDRAHHLFRRFVPYQAFPGPAVGFIRELCERHARSERGRPLTAEDAVDHFIRRYGLPGWLLRDQEPLDREQLLATLRARIIGQEEAVQAAVRVVTTLKVGLNDPQRPLGVLLFLGPTGVGKTELARALAAVLFGNRSSSDSLDPHSTTRVCQAEARLVRLDMSEYAGPDAVERLLGPPHGEPGMLIRRLRQQPFCVLLLDEIEKATPEVFDALMGVCDEGRLTDRFGRTTTFRSCLILMTSNLGSERRKAFGFGERPPPYADAARTFFRPEFYNRLDAVVTFDPLGRETIRAITLKELAEVELREGIARSGLRLRWSDRLVAWLGREGFDARLGARPLQRVLERHVVAPLARYLLTHPTLADTELLIDRLEAGEVRVCAPDECDGR